MHDTKSIPMPDHKKLIIAACMYWDVTEDFFKIKRKDGETEKRSTLFYLLHEHAGLDYASIARMYERSAKSSIFEACENIDVIKNINTPIKNAIRDILKMAEIQV